MVRRVLLFLGLLCSLVSLPAAPVRAAVSSPVLKWAGKGCASWCQTGWYGSPAVADLDKDGKPLDKNPLK